LSQSLNSDPLNQDKNKNFNSNKEVFIDQAIDSEKLSSYDKYFGTNTKNNPTKQKLLDKWTKLTTIYNSDSPIFSELFKTLNEERLDDVTQLKIEKFLMDQAQIFIEAKLSSKGKNNTISNGSQGIFVNRKIDSEVVKQLIESESDFKKLITNYKYNIKEVCLNDSETLTANHIIYTMDTNIIISYSYGRLMRVLSNFQMINKDNKFLEVAISIGKDFVREYLFARYKVENTEKNITFLEWKISNNTKVEFVNDSEFVFKIGSKVLS
jgi:hypothetical protein